MIDYCDTDEGIAAIKRMRAVYPQIIDQFKKLAVEAFSNAIAEAKTTSLRGAIYMSAEKAMAHLERVLTVSEMIQQNSYPLTKEAAQVIKIESGVYCACIHIKFCATATKNGCTFDILSMTPNDDGSEDTGDWMPGKSD